MKKKLALLLALSLLVGILAGCTQDLGMAVQEDGSGTVSVELRISVTGLTFLASLGVDTNAIRETSERKIIDGKIYRVFTESWAFSNPDMLNTMLQEANSGDMAQHVKARVFTTRENGFWWLTLTADVTKKIEGLDAGSFTLPQEAIPEEYDEEQVKKILEGIRALAAEDELSLLMTITLPNADVTTTGMADAVTVSGNTVVIDLMKANQPGTFTLKARLGAAEAARSLVKAVATYDGRFTDMPTEEWKQSAIIANFNSGLMKGMSDTAFEPDGTLTVAQAVTMAANVRALYNGETIELGEPWYSTYVAYAQSQGILLPGDFSEEELNGPCTRGVMAYLFANALPLTQYAVINEGASVPDMDPADPLYPFVARLYESGIAIGDGYHRYNPDNTITRVEAAAILSRISDPTLRREI